MRHYKTKKIGVLLVEKRKELGTLELAGQYKELATLWGAIPDPTLQKLKVTHQITQERVIQIVCPSSVALTYVRQRRDIIESSLKEFMVAHQFVSLEIIIK
ncbi:MAG: hypothetical protein PUK66_03270 [Bacteroidales bacterium]|uniref:hypothetical protein n=1 Tax=Porphyromonas sp. TaxID=1924944 RepID=UPI00297737E7|nr:hypothetical protein [Porphyromonas sp.]MDD7437841.1 hypothetical protein [Bacteroidales bacterium]MDY3067139.1 hypothetical protein [Porphyromonas sp.]